MAEGRKRCRVREAIGNGFEALGCGLDVVGCLLPCVALIVGVLVWWT